MNQTTMPRTDQATSLLKVALPNKGALADQARQMLSEAGYRQRNDSKDLVLVDQTNQVEFYYLRPKDIALAVGRGTLHLGLTGRDMLIDSASGATEVLSMGFGRSTFRFAAPLGEQEPTLEDLRGRRIATSYPGLVGGYLRDQGIEAELVKLDGAVESAIRLGVADAIADVVETGATLKKAGLAVFGEPICQSEAVVIAHPDLGDKAGAADQLLRRLSSVLVAQNYVLIDYNIDNEHLDAAIGLTPGLDGPTVSTLAREGWVAVRAMVPRQDRHQLMDELYATGARAILVSDIAACRL